MKESAVTHLPSTSPARLSLHPPPPPPPSLSSVSVCLPTCPSWPLFCAVRKHGQYVFVSLQTRLRATHPQAYNHVPEPLQQGRRVQEQRPEHLEKTGRGGRERGGGGGGAHMWIDPSVAPLYSAMLKFEQCSAEMVAV